MRFPGTIQSVRSWLNHHVPPPVIHFSENFARVLFVNLMGLVILVEQSKEIQDSGDVLIFLQ
jgi:hypothetical protein